MIRHIVLWSMREETLDKLDSLLDQLRGMAEIDEVRALSADLLLNDSTHDAVLSIDIDDEAALARYVEHPVHQAAGARLVELAATIDVADFPVSVPSSDPPYVVSRGAERPRFDYADLGLTEDRLCTDPRMSFTAAHFEPGGNTGPELRTHGSDIECIFVTDGEVKVMLADDELELHAGDAVHFDGSVPHGCKNDGFAPAEILWATIPGNKS